MVLLWKYKHALRKTHQRKKSESGVFNTPWQLERAACLPASHFFAPKEPKEADFPLCKFTFPTRN